MLISASLPLHDCYRKELLLDKRVIWSGFTLVSVVIHEQSYFNAEIVAEIGFIWNVYGSDRIGFLLPLFVLPSREQSCLDSDRFKRSS